MPAIIATEANARFFWKSDLICFLNPTKNPIEEKIIIFIMQKRRLNLRILRRDIEITAKTPENRAKNAQTANAIIFCVVVSSKHPPSSSSMVRSNKPVTKLIGAKTCPANFTKRR